MTINLLNTDCMDYMATLDDNAFDLAIVDPPWGIGMGNRTGADYKGRSQKGKYKTGAWDESRPNKEYFSELLRVSVNQIIWGGNYFCDLLPISRGWLFWDKAPILPNYSAGELAWSSFDAVLQRKKINWNGKLRTGIEPGYKSIHPTQKPKKLYQWIMSLYAKPGQRILDTHLGSGSSAIAAHYFGVDFVGCEIDKDYYDAAVKRFDKETRQIAMEL